MIIPACRLLTILPSTLMSWMANRRMMVQIIPRVIFRLPSTISVQAKKDNSVDNMFSSLAQGVIRSSSSEWYFIHWKPEGKRKYAQGSCMRNLYYCVDSVKVMTSLGKEVVSMARPVHNPVKNVDVLTTELLLWGWKLLDIANNCRSSKCQWLLTTT